MSNDLTGQGSVLFGLTNLNPALDPTSAPQVGDAFAYADLGHFATVTATYVPVPEPSAFALFGGLAALGIVRFRRRSKA